MGLYLGGRGLTVFDVVTSSGGNVATEVQDGNPAQTKVYDLVGSAWVEQ